MCLSLASLDFLEFLASLLEIFTYVERAFGFAQFKRKQFKEIHVPEKLQFFIIFPARRAPSF
jgi:hypothetical protein